MTKTTIRGDLVSAIYFACILILVVAGAKIYPSLKLDDDSYLLFVLKQGPLFALTFSLISVIWRDLDKKVDLISSDPARYASACFIVVSGVFHSMAGGLHKSREASDEGEQGSQEADSKEIKSRPSMALLASTPVILVKAFYLVAEAFITIALNILLFFVSFFWLFCIAPPLYFVNLVTGAPARNSLRGSEERSLMVRQAGKWFRETEHAGRNGAEEDKSPGEFDDELKQIEEWEKGLVEIKAGYRKKGLPTTQVAEFEDDLAKLKRHFEKRIFDVTLSKRPVSLTSAITSLVLWLASIMVSKFPFLSGLIH